MILKISLLILTILISKSKSFNLNGKNYILDQNFEDKDGGVVTTVLSSEDVCSKSWAARIIYNKTYLTTGWDLVDIETNPAISDEDQAFFAGYLEGVETQAAIYDHFYNTITPVCGDETKICRGMQDYLDTNTQWIKDMIEQHAASDIYWRQIKLFYLQMDGLVMGYNTVAPSDQKLDLNDILWMNFNADFEDLRKALEAKEMKVKTNMTHCSALVKLLPSDILVAHNSWIGYERMRRMIKRYTLPFKQVIATKVSFSGYPGILVSIDDFHILNSGLVTLETSIDNNNRQLWSQIKPIGQVLEVVRVAVANRLADGGHSWSKIFSQYNSGTYNNQWMIVDMKKFTPGLVKPGLLWIAEQTPGYIRREDKTDVLTSQGYWASYNVPYFPDVFKRLHSSPDDTNRALIFKRDQGKVVDLDSMMRLMRSNDFKRHDSSSISQNPANAIAARADVGESGSVFGAIDAKVTSYQMSKSLSMLAVCGPTTGTYGQLPPFEWSKSPFNLIVRHRGHPDVFNFKPVLIS